MNFEKKLGQSVMTAYHRIKDYRQIAATAAAAFVAALLLTYFAVSRHNLGVLRASEKFSSAQGMYSQGMTDRAADIFAEVIAQYPRSEPASHARINLAEIRIASGDYDGSRELARAVYTSGRPKTLRPFGLYLSILAMDEKGDPSASAEAELFIEKYPDHFLTPRVYEKLGMIYEKSGRLDDARRTYKRMAALYPASAWAARSAAGISAMGAGAAKQ
jgi:TolA-binding protein